MTDELRSSMQAAGGSVAKLRAEIKLADSELRINTQTVGTAREKYEALRITQDLLSGDFTRAGATIARMGEHMAAHGDIAELAASEELIFAAAAIAATAALGYMTYKQIEADEHARSLAAGFTLTGRGALASAAAIEAEINDLASLRGSTEDAARALVEFDADHAQVSARMADMANQLLPIYIDRFGKEAPAAINKLKQALADIDGSSIKEAVDKFAALNRESLNLGPNEEYAITQMLLLGKQTEATTRIMEDLGLRSGVQLDNVDTEVQQVTGQLKTAETALEKLQELGPEAFDPNAPAAFGDAVAVATNDVAQLEARLEGLQGIQRDEDERKITGSADMAGQTVASDIRPHERRTGGGRGHAPSVVQEWAEQLRAQEVKSTDFFKDQTADELAFWQSKLGLVKDKSKEWLEVQGHIYDLSKQQAHAAYDAQLGSISDQMEADKNSWTAQQAGWLVKLSVIRGTLGEESAAYKQAYKEFEAAEHAHQTAMAQAVRDGNTEALAELKGNLDAARSVRETEARAAESGITSQAAYAGPLGKLQADRQVAALHQQLLAQQMADDTTYHARADALLEADVNLARQTYGQDSAEYQKAIDAKKLADQQFFNQHKQLAAQMVAQERQDAARIAQTWHSYVDPMVQTTGAQIQQLAKGTETWGQALLNVGDQALSMLVDAIERTAEQWIVSMITQDAAQKASSAGQVESYAGVAGAAGVASFAGAPWPVDMGAPAFGADMAASALAFGSFERGVNVMPHDAIVQVHRGERITPDGDNRAIMSAVAGGGRSGGGATVNNHYSPTIHAHEPPSLPRMLETHGSDMIAFMQRAIRDRRLTL